MNKYHAVSCSHLLGGNVGHWVQAPRAMSSTLPQSHPKSHFRRVGYPCRAGRSSKHSQLLGPGVWAGGSGRDLWWGFGQAPAAARGLLSPARASLFCKYKTVSKQQNAFF